MLDFLKTGWWPRITLDCSSSIIVPKFGSKILINAQIMPENQIQNGGRRHLEFVSNGKYLEHTAAFQLLI